MVKKSGAKKTTNSGRKFSISDSFSYGWVKTKKYFWATLGIALLCQFVSGILSVLQLSVGALGLIIWVFSIFVGILINIGWGKIIMAVLAGKKPELKYFSWDNIEYFWNYLATNLLYGLIVVIGYILLVIPGIVWSLTYSLAPLLVIDKKLPFDEALAASRKYMAGQRWNVFLWGIVIALFNFVGALCLGIGLLFTVPVSFYASVYLYGKLTEKTVK